MYMASHASKSGYIIDQDVQTVFENALSKTFE